jgi:integrase
MQWIDGKRRSQTIGTKQEFPTKALAWKAVKPLPEKQTASTSPVVSTLVDQYRQEKMPKRSDTRRTYDAWLRNHIVPTWGTCALTDLQARPVELWLDNLALSPKSKVHIRGTLSILWDFAMWRGDLPTMRNPMSLVTVKGATKRSRKQRSLTVDEFQRFAQHLSEPFKTLALLCACLGLRVSEALGLRWSDVNWMGGTLAVERGIVCQVVDDVKSAESRKELPIDGGLLEVLKEWKQTTQFSEAEDYIFASPAQIGRLPWSYDQIWRVYQKAGAKAGIGGLGTHCLRHTYRSWLDAVGTGLAVQQKLMRHASINQTMRYGDVVTDEMTIASGKVADLALNGSQSDRKPS